MVLLLNVLAAMRRSGIEEGVAPAAGAGHPEGGQHQAGRQFERAIVKVACAVAVLVITRRVAVLRMAI